MTIVAGFLLQDCVLLCADTMVTSMIKLHDSKLMRFQTGEGPERIAAGFAIAGNEVNARMAIQDCVEGLTERPKEELTFREATKILRAAILNINQQYVEGRSDVDKDHARFDLVIGAWLPRGGGLKLFSTAGGPGLVEREYEFLGSGFYLGHYVVSPAFDRRMRLEELVLLAIQAIAAAKKYDPYCGGDTELMILNIGGTMSESIPYKASAVEAYIADFEQMCRKLLLDIANSSVDENQLDTRLREFSEGCKRIRAFLQNRGLEYLSGFLDRLMQSMKSGPESTTTDPSHQPPSQE